jgi:hypothetical protein
MAQRSLGPGGENIYPLFVKDKFLEKGKRNLQNFAMLIALEQDWTAPQQECSQNTIS